MTDIRDIFRPQKRAPFFSWIPKPVTKEDTVIRNGRGRLCIPRGRSCFAGKNLCCGGWECRCNLFGSNCKCERPGLFGQKIPKNSPKEPKRDTHMEQNK